MQFFALKCCSMELEMDSIYAGRCGSHKSEVVLFQELFSPFHQRTRSVGSCIDFYLLLNASKYSQNCFLPPYGFLLWNDWLTDYYYWWCSCKSLIFSICFSLFIFAFEPFIFCALELQQRIWELSLTVYLTISDEIAYVTICCRFWYGFRKSSLHLHGCDNRKNGYWELAG
jgi:hypothetical protein